MLAQLVIVIALAVVCYLRWRTGQGVLVPLSVWMIPAAILTAAGAFWVGVRVDDVMIATQSAAPTDRPGVLAEGLANVNAWGRYFFMAAASITCLATAFAGTAGQRRHGQAPFYRRAPFFVGSGLAVVIGLLTYTLLTYYVVDASVPGFWVYFIPPSIVAGAGIGIARTLGHETPSSFPLAIAGIGLAGLIAFYIGGAMMRWEADCLNFLFDSGEFVALGASSPYAGLDSVILIVSLGAGVSLLTLAVIGARLKGEPWKWGMLGDGVLFLLVSLIFASGLGWTWMTASEQYDSLRKMAAPAAAETVHAHKP